MLLVLQPQEEMAQAVARVVKAVPEAAAEIAPVVKEVPTVLMVQLAAEQAVQDREPLLEHLANQLVIFTPAEAAVMEPLMVRVAVLSILAAAVRVLLERTETGVLLDILELLSSATIGGEYIGKEYGKN